MPAVKLTAAERNSELCTHTRQAHAVSYTEHVCPECVAMGDTWVHLRICMICGHVGCCDNSKNRHATKHYHTTQHPIVKTIEDEPEWAWCYVDEEFLT